MGSNAVKTASLYKSLKASYYQNIEVVVEVNRIYQGDSGKVLKAFPSNSIDCCVTSPPYYGLRNYGEDEQIGLETTPEEYVKRLVLVFDEVYRVLKDDGTFWLNLGDSYAGSGKANGMDFDKCSDVQRKNKGTLDHATYVRQSNKGCKDKDLIGIPWLTAFVLRNRGWHLRQDIIWAKSNCMPESVKDRCTRSHEYIFLLTKGGQILF